MSNDGDQIEAIPFGRIFRNLLIFGLVMLLLGEFLFRKRYAEPERSVTPEIRAIQRHLVLNEALGFTWKPNIMATDEITFENQDTDSYPLSTDQWGFINTPDAIREREGNMHVDVVGLGDSFLEHGTHVLTDFFSIHDLSYYNLALHRQSPPQYTEILKSRAIPMNPNWIVYSIFENDFQEIVDYRNWKASDDDWFTFHSGTWCGVPTPQTSVARFREKYLRGYSALYGVIQSKLLGDALSIDGLPEGSVELIHAEIAEAHDTALDAKVGFVVLLIPGRSSVLGTPSLEAKAYDAILDRLAKEGIGAVDLRDVFAADPDPTSLYYRVNGHWNAKGITLAAQSVLEYFESNTMSRE